MKTTENSEPNWLKLLKQKVPQPTICGDANDIRIFHGKKTDIDQFPWTVLLEYRKG